MATRKKKSAKKKAPSKKTAKKGSGKKKEPKLTAGKKIWERAAADLVKGGYLDSEDEKATDQVWRDLEAVMSKKLGEKVKVTRK